MPSVQIQKPVNATDNAEPKKPRTAHNKISAERESQVRALLRDGIAGKAVAKRLGLSQNAVYRVLSEMRPTGTPKRNPTKCSGEASCDCVLCGARAEAARRLAELRKNLKQGVTA